MSTVKKVSVALTHDMVDTVKLAVDSGEYGSSSEVVRDALRHWQIRRDRKASEIKLLSEAWTKGLNSGPGKYKDIHAIIEAAKKT